MTTGTVTAERYSRGAVILHWLIAVLIALNYAAAWVSEDMPKEDKLQVMANHKAIGIIILLLTLVRIGWRLLHSPPPLGESLKAWEVALAKVVHGLAYLAMLAIPLSGWAMHSAFSGGKPVGLFGLFAFPALPMAQNKPLGEVLEAVHGSLATLLLVLMALHVAGALKHQLLDRDGSMRRMLPWG